MHLRVCRKTDYRVKFTRFFKAFARYGTKNSVYSCRKIEHSVFFRLEKRYTIFIKLCIVMTNNCPLFSISARNITHRRMGNCGCTGMYGLVLLSSKCSGKFEKCSAG